MADYDKIFGNADGMHFTFVGNIDLHGAKSLFEKYLGSLLLNLKSMRLRTMAQDLCRELY